MLHERGLTHLEIGDTAKAQADFEAAITLNPEDPKSHYDLGLLHHRQQRPFVAIAEYTRALELQPSYTQAWQNRAMVYSAVGQNSNAINDLSRLLELTDPSDPTHQTIIGWLSELQSGNNPFQ